MHAYHCFVLLLLLAPAPAQNARRPAPEDLLPATTWFHARLAGLGGGRAALEKSGLFQLANREETRSLTERGMKEIEPHVEHALAMLRSHVQELGVAPDVLRTLLQGPMALGLGRTTLFDAMLVPSPLLVIDVAGREEQAREAFAAACRAVAAHMPLPPGAKETFQGVEIQRLGPIAHAWVDGFLLVGLNDHYLKDAIASRKSGTTLASKPAVVRNRARLPGEPVLSVDLDLSFFLGWIERFLPYEANEFGNAFGIDGLSGIHFAIGPAGRGDMTVVQLDIPGSEKGLFKALMSQPVTFKAAAWLPAETAVFMSTSLDGKALAGGARVAMATLPESVREQLQWVLDQEITGHVNHGLKALGFDVDGLLDCLSCLGTQLTLAANVPPKGGLVPEALLFAEVNDGKKAEAMLLGMLDQFVPGGRKTMPFKEHTIHWLEVPDAPIKLSPCFVVTDGMVIASLNPQVLKKALGRGSKREGSLAADPRFEALVKETGRSNLFIDLRLPAAVRWAHDFGHPFVEMFLEQHPELGIDAAAVPTPETLEQALEDITFSANVDQHGITLTARSSAGPGSVLAGTLATADWLLEKLGKGKIY